jgi:predicted transposase/invertase (TIGR01784 family)
MEEFLYQSWYRMGTDILYMDANKIQDTLEEASGKIQYNMTNDYMFRAVLESNMTVLRGLVCSVLHLRDEEVASVVILNPIELGKAVGDKGFYLDLNVLLNDSTQIDLEMQIKKYGNWTDRSLNYLCRSYDRLYRGEDYGKSKAAVHIGFLGYTLFEEAPEFYATYKMMNVKNHRIYSDKLRLGVVDLSKIELATQEDKSYGTDHWAALFKAGTWEELKALGEGNMAYEEAVKTLYRLSADENIQEQCYRREIFLREQRMMQESIKEQEALIREQGAKLEEKDARLAEQGAKLEEQGAKLAEKDAKLAELMAEIEELKKAQAK